MNKIFLIGNLTKDPETGKTKNDVQYTRFTIAVNRAFTNADGKREVDYFDVAAWRKLAEHCNLYLAKGNKVSVTGAMQQNKYKDKDGNEHTSWSVNADEVEFLTPKNKSDVPEGLTPVEGEDLPF